MILDLVLDYKNQLYIKPKINTSLERRWANNGVFAQSKFEH